MKMKTIKIMGVICATAITMPALAMQDTQDDAKKKDKMLMDPLTRAELQCVELKTKAANGSADEQREAEKKCLEAIERAKEMMKKKKKPKPEEDPNGS